MKNRVCEVLGIEKPVIQGPMAWIATAPLVASVSEAGGLGVLGLGLAPLELATEQARLVRELTDKPFAINVALMHDFVESITEMVKVVHPPVLYGDTIPGLELDVELITKYFKIWHDLGCKIVVKIGNLEDAIKCEKAGADIIIAKGWEGGGHIYFESTMILIPLIKEHISVPLIASGGIANGHGAAAATVLGAEAIEMGTIFIASKEAAIHENAKKALVECGDMQTVIAGAATKRPCRQIKNELSDEMLKLEEELPYSEAAEKIVELSSGSLRAAMVEGNVTDKGAVMAGQNAPLINEIRPVADIIDAVLTECNEIIKNIQPIWE